MSASSFEASDGAKKVRGKKQMIFWGVVITIVGIFITDSTIHTLAKTAFGLEVADIIAVAFVSFIIGGLIIKGGLRVISNARNRQP